MRIPGPSPRAADLPSLEWAREFAFLTKFPGAPDATDLTLRNKGPEETGQSGLG